jgi:signal transduction histidine kinase/ActR/RegA family two-component response regulator
LWQRWAAVLRRALPARLMPQVETGLGHYLLLMGLIVPALGALFGLLYHQELKALTPRGEFDPNLLAALEPTLRAGFVKAYAALLLVAGVVAWWLVLAHQSRRVALEETTRQTEALVREIALHQQTDLQLQEAKRIADAANQAKTRYITTISHELRTPLNSILGYAQLLEDDPAMPAHRRQAVSVIRRGGDHLLGLIEGTLDVARIEGGKLTLDVKPMRLRDGLREIAHMFAPMAQAKGIAFVFEGGDALPEVVRADERRLRQILINLLGNAVKFTTRGQITLRVQHAREMARVDIVDSGPGMGADELARVFEPFVRGAASSGKDGNAAAGGTGLGLTISKMLTDLMGGEMTVTSAPGQGSTFSLRLFLPEVRAGQGGDGAEGAPPRAQRHGYAGPRRHILVVDNEEADRQLLVDMLQPQGFVIHPACSGEDALAQLATLKPDAILMDLAMPGLDGWQTMARIRALGLSDAPLAVVSANAFDRGLDNEVRLPAADFLVKPVRVADLLDWLGQRLHLPWLPAPADAPAGPEPSAVPPEAAAIHYPPTDAIERLQALVGLGYLRGITRELDRIEAEHAAASAFVAQLRQQARAFQLDAMTQTLLRARDELRRP